MILKVKCEHRVYKQAMIEFITTFNFALTIIGKNLDMGQRLILGILLIFITACRGIGSHCE